MIESILNERNLPQISVEGREWESCRAEMKKLLCEEEYGYLPPKPQSTSYTVISESTSFCDGKATLLQIQITLQMQAGEFSFPMYCAFPHSDKPVPVLVHITSNRTVPEENPAIAEICEHGFAVAAFNCLDVASDGEEFTDGISVSLFPNGVRQADSAGKLMLWAWGAMRIMDYLQEQSWTDKKRIGIVGHSRLGKAALLVGALDERFKFTFANDSGCAGAAINRGKQGETVTAICGRFPYWFCDNFKTYINHEEKLTFDQHFLLAMIAPRYLYVASAQDDAWADPQSEYLGCWAVSPIYQKLGGKGFIAPDRLPMVDDAFHEGNVGYHMRAGGHALTAYDWLRFMEYMEKHKD